MSLKSSFALALIFIALGTVAIFDPFEWKEKRQEKREKEGSVFWIKKEKIEWIAIESGNTIRFLCQLKDGCPLDSGGEWKLASPIDELADNNNVGTLLTSLDTLTAMDRLGFEKEILSLSEFGLDAPLLTLKFKVKGSKGEEWIKLGNKSPVGPNYYAVTSGSKNEILLVGGHFYEALSQGLTHWRNKRIFPGLRTEQVQELIWQNFSFAHKDGTWIMKKPYEAQANSSMLNGLAGAVAFLSATDIKEVKQTANLGRPKLVLQARADGKSHKLEFFEKGKELLLVSSAQNWIASVEPELLERFRKPLAEYRNKQLIDISTKAKAEVWEFHFPRQKQHAIFKQDDKGNWSQIGGDLVKLSTPRLERFVSAFSGNAVVGFSDDRGMPLEKLRDLRLVLKDKDGSLLREFSFIVANKKTVLTQGERVNELRSLGSDLVRAIPIRLADLDLDNNKVVVDTSPEVPVHDRHNH